MTFSAEQLLLIIAAIGVVLVNVITAWKQNTKTDITDRKVEASLRQNDVLLTKAKEIHDLTNGNLSAMTKLRDEALGEIQALKLLVKALQAEKETTFKLNGVIE